MRRVIKYFFCFLIICCACQSKKITTTKVKPEERTAFYDIKFKYDSIQKKSIITINSIKVVDIRINYVPDEHVAKQESFVFVEITDKDNNTIKAYIDHPLHRRFDVYEESGKIESKLVSLREANMSLRVPYYSPYNKIKITETVNRTQTLTTILKNEK